MQALRIASALAIAMFAAACTNSSAFTCSEDSSCVLGDVGGICTEVGQCAYPSQECETGWEYPPGTPGALANTCAPGPSGSSGSATDGGTSASTSSASDGSDAGTSTTTGMMTSDSTTTDVTSTTDGATGDVSAGSTGGGTTGSTATCSSPDEPDEFDAAQPVAAQNCDFVVEGFHHAEQDADWYTATVEDTCDNGSFNIEPPMSAQLVCLFAECPVVGAGIECLEAEFTTLGDLEGCCSEAPHSGSFSMQAPGICDPPDAFYVLVAGDANDVTGECVAYDFLMNYVD